MKLYEILIAAFFVPAFWFFWMWAFRLLVVGAAAKLIGGIKDKALNKLRGEPDANGDKAQV